MPSILDQDRMPPLERLAFAVLGIFLFVLVAIHAIFGFLGIAFLFHGARGRYGKIEVVRHCRCPECNRAMEVYKRVASEDQIDGLLSSTTITRYAANVKCTACAYEATLDEYEDNRQRQQLQRELSQSSPQETEIQMKKLDQDLVRERLKAKINNKRGQREAHPDSGRLINDYGTSCPSCRETSALQYRRWIRRHAQPLATPVTLEAQSYVECHHCDYLVSLASYKKAKQLKPALDV